MKFRRSLLTWPECNLTECKLRKWVVFKLQGYAIVLAYELKHSLVFQPFASKYATNKQLFPKSFQNSNGAK